MFIIAAGLILSEFKNNPSQKYIAFIILDLLNAAVKNGGKNELTLGAKAIQLKILYYKDWLDPKIRLFVQVSSAIFPGQVMFE